MVKLSAVIETLKEQVKKVADVITNRLDRLIYLNEINTEHECLNFKASTTERTIKFSKGAFRHLTIASDDSVWIDFDRKAEANVSHNILADETLNINLWVEAVHAVTTIGTANVRVIGLR